MLNLAELHLQLTKLSEVSPNSQKREHRGEKGPNKLEDLREGLSPAKRPTCFIASILASKPKHESRQDNPLIK